MSTEATFFEGNGYFINRDLLTGEIMLYTDGLEFELEITEEAFEAIKKVMTWKPLLDVVKGETP